MSILKPGDKVDVRLLLNMIVGPYEPDWDQVKTFEIVCADRNGYYIFIPCYLFLKGSVRADQYFCRKLNIDKRFIDEQVSYVEESLIYKVNSIMDGCFCCRCREFYYQAEPNQLDGTLICWSCRDDPYR